jgi:dipeptidyl aminopeptidase/acylaminoacyl peptidase
MCLPKKGDFMNVRRLLLASAIGLSAVAQPARAGDLASDAKAFGARDTIQSMDISPSGKQLVAVVSGWGRKTVVKMVDAATKVAHGIIVSEGSPEAVHWCKFASETQLICKYGGYTKLEGDVVGFSRLITIGTDGKNVRPLGQPSRANDMDIRQFDGDVLDWLPDRPGSVLMQRNYVQQVNLSGLGDTIEGAKGLGVDRIDLSNLKITPVERPAEDAQDYLTDGRGNVRMMMLAKTIGGSELTGVYKFRYRRVGSDRWDDFSEYDGTRDIGDVPIAIEANSDSAFVLAKTDGRDALYQVKLDGSRARSLIAANKQVDIDSVVRLGNGQKVIGYTYVDDRRRTVYFDPEIKSMAAVLGKALSQQPVLSILNASADGSKLLILAYGDTDPGSFYVYDKANRHLDEVGVVRVPLLGMKLAPVQSITFPAADGVSVPAYLTLPEGSEGKGLPTVVLPHGGPSARDEWAFDWLPQFLAARGYAVIQPNFRGSAGYGDDWLARNGFQGWRSAIGDLTASANYLVSKGIADANRLAIVGWSYGGYAALLSGAEQPALYKAVVAIAPVTDLNLLKREATNFTNARLVSGFVGSGPEIVRGSPLQRASEIKAPVLLFHGDLDGNVNIEHSTKMIAALRKAGDRAELVRFPGLDHQLDDSDARTQMLTRIGEFLDAAIGH